MADIILFRTATGNYGTFGHVWVDGEKLFKSLEPPWKNNLPNLSCIPPGKYTAVWHRSPRYGHVYLLIGTEGRSFILNHAGNFGGDVTKGLKTHTKGCILFGMRFAHFGGQKAISSSRTAIRRFHSITGGEDLNINILQLF